MLSRARGDRGPFALVGAWAGNSALIGSEPVAHADGAEAVLTALDALPAVSGRLPRAVGGGWVGYLGYGLGSAFEDLPPPPKRPLPVEVASLGFYDHLIRLDATNGLWYFEALSTRGREAELEQRLSLWRERVNRRQDGHGAKHREGPAPFAAIPGAEGHVRAVERAIGHICAGDLFQVNVCRRLEADYCGDPVSLFCRGARALRPRYGAFVGGPGSSVASFSPELFVRRRGDDVVSSPVKGTIRRCPDDGAASAGLLVSSEKDRAENLMIVDLMRNDFGRVARYGTVAVPALFRLEAHPGLWHLVSDVTARLSSGVSNAQLLAATFPPGSVTGAPKVRAMQLIAELESTAREVYTGAVGLVSPLSGLELNVAIRTVEMAAGKAWLGVGGGIVADSDPESELRECETKAAPILEALA